MKRITLPGFKVGEAVILNEGEFVARWDTCPTCNGRKWLSKNLHNGTQVDCYSCNGTGRVAVPVEEKR